MSRFIRFVSDYTRYFTIFIKKILFSSASINLLVFNLFLWFFMLWSYFSFYAVKTSLFVENINFFCSLEINANNLFSKINYNLNILYLYLIIICLLTIILWLLPTVLSIKKFSIEKNSAYECGFEPFFLEQSTIEVHFLIVALLFLIFDLEIIFLVPLSLYSSTLGSFGIFLLYTYLFSVIAMLIVEFVSGALTWPTWYNYE